MKESFTVFPITLFLTLGFVIPHFIMDIEKDYNIYWILLFLEFFLEFLACAILPVYIIAKKKVMRTYLLNEVKNILN